MKSYIQKQNKGITLIALVITIIVLLILAGVTIASLSGSDSTPEKANEAKQKYDIGTAKDQVNIFATNAQTEAYGATQTTGEQTSNDISDFVKDKIDTEYGEEKKIGSASILATSGGEIIIISTTDYKDVGTISETGGTITWSGVAENDGIMPEPGLGGKNNSNSNRTLAGKKTGYSSKNPVIPKGFIAVDVGDANWTYSDSNRTVVAGWNNGLVIQDAENGNQFVWVPCTTASDNNVATSGIVNYAKKYSYPTNFGSHSASNTTDQNDSADGYSAIPVTETTQIENYGGFYVARFEAGLESANSSSSNNIVGTPISKEGTKVWNNVDYYVSYKSANSMIKNTTKYGNNKSGLITGTQWDTIMQWFESSNIPVLRNNQNWGTYRSKRYEIAGLYFTKGSSVSDWINATQTTDGKVIHNATNSDISDSNKGYFHASGLNKDNGYQKNIADLGGNLWEWSAEAYSGIHIFRGGCANDPYSWWTVSCRSGFDWFNYAYDTRF